jgi:hypothetical protein
MSEQTKTISSVATHKSLSAQFLQTDVMNTKGENKIPHTFSLCGFINDAETRSVRQVCAQFRQYIHSPYVNCRNNHLVLE